jgi:hypothetical protein
MRPATSGTGYDPEGASRSHRRLREPKLENLLQGTVAEDLVAEPEVARDHAYSLLGSIRGAVRMSHGRSLPLSPIQRAHDLHSTCHERMVHE